MKLSDIVQGRTIYKVSVFPYQTKEFQRNNTNITKAMIASRPYIHRFKHSNAANNVFDVINKYGHRDKDFCSTWRIGEDNQYNLHRAFLSRREAEAYMRRMLAMQLTKKEVHFASILRDKHIKLERSGFFDAPIDIDSHMPEDDCRPFPYLTQFAIAVSPPTIIVRGL